MKVTYDYNGIEDPLIITIYGKNDGIVTPLLYPEDFCPLYKTGERLFF